MGELDLDAIRARYETAIQTDNAHALHDCIADVPALLAELDAALEECDGYRNDLTMLRLRKGGYDRAVANLRDGDRFALWVAAQPFDQDLANDEPSRQQLADYLDSTKETDR